MQPFVDGYDPTGQHGERRSAASSVAKDPVVVSGHFPGADWPPARAQSEPVASAV